MPKYFIIFISLFLLVTFNAQAEDVSAEKKLLLQDLMNQFIDEISDDGKMIYNDTSSNELITLYFATAQPMYVPQEENYFLCTSGFGENGEEHLVDFYAQEVGGGYKIVDISVDNCRCFGRQAFNTDYCQKSCLKILVNFFCI